jgi:predicted AAA+ superfamily ATPase
LALVEWALEAEMTDSLARLVERAEQLISASRRCCPAPGRARLDAIRAWRYRKRAGHGRAGAGAPPGADALSDLKNIDAQKDKIERNTSSSSGPPANNVLLTGARGTGKSSLIKACLNALRRRACA